MEKQDIITVEEDPSNIGNPVWHIELTSNAIAQKSFFVSAFETTKEEAIELVKKSAMDDVRSCDLGRWKLLGLWKDGIIDVKRTEWNLECDGTMLHPNQLRLPRK